VVILVPLPVVVKRDADPAGVVHGDGRIDLRDLQIVLDNLGRAAR
jgi:hypothetical protein